MGRKARTVGRNAAETPRAAPAKPQDSQGRRACAAPPNNQRATTLARRIQHSPSRRDSKKTGTPFQAVHLHPNSHAGYFPGAKPIALKVVFDPQSGKLLGAQAVGEDGVDKRIDVIATAIFGGMTIHDLAELELCYAPPFGSAKDPINLAGMAAQNVTEGMVTVAQWHEVPALIAAGAVVVDVREPGERDGGIIPGSRSIPLGSLRDRLSELPKDAELLVHCASGQRSYNACRVLTQHGFKCRNLTGSFKTWKAANAS